MEGKENSAGDCVGHLQGMEDSQNPLGKSAVQLRAEAIFRKRPSTPPDAAEIRAWDKAAPIVAATSDDEWTTLEAFYAATETRERPLYRRKDLATLLNNWSGEIAKAKTWQANRSRYEGAF